MQLKQALNMAFLLSAKLQIILRKKYVLKFGNVKLRLYFYSVIITE